jgi:hypothetical protein
MQARCIELTDKAAAAERELQDTREQALHALTEKDEELARVRHGRRSSSTLSSVHETTEHGIVLRSPGSGSDNGQLVASTATSRLVTEAGQTNMVDYWKRLYDDTSLRAQALQRELSLVQTELADERHVHELRDLADGARKIEIRELQASQGRSVIDVEYLKNALVGFFESGELNFNPQVLVILDRLLLFTAQDRYVAAQTSCSLTLQLFQVENTKRVYEYLCRARIWKSEGARNKESGFVMSFFR